MTTESILEAKAHSMPLDGSQEWYAPLRAIVEGALETIWARGGDAQAARCAAYEALLQVAADVAIHTVECIDSEGDHLPNVLNAAIADFALNARVQMLGAAVDCGLCEPVA